MFTPPQLVDRPGTRTHQHQCDDTGNVQQVAFITWWTELRSSIAVAEQPDGAEPVGQMDRNNGNNKQDDCWNAHQEDKRSKEERDTTENLNRDCCPSHQVGSRY